MSKPLAFISYIHEDEAFAFKLRDWLHNALLGGIDFFIAGDRGSVPLGEDWPSKISNALRKCNAGLILVSRKSVERKWIYFEAGAAAARGIPVIPICCNGLNKDSLTPPLSFFQAIELPSKKNERQLLQALAGICQLKVPTRVSPFSIPLQDENGVEKGRLINPISGELSDKPYHIFKDQIQANLFLHKYVELSPNMNKVQLIQYSSDRVKNVIYALLEKGVETELLIKHPDSAIDEFQRGKILDQINTFRNNYDEKVKKILKVYLYKELATIRGVKIEPSLIVIGPYTYLESTVRGHDNPAILFNTSNADNRFIVSSFDVLFTAIFS